MGTRLDQAAEEYSKKYPYYKTYVRCQSFAFMTGMATFVGATAVSFVVQDHFRSHFPWPRTTYLLSSILVGGATAYLVTRARTKRCQQIWMALEDKHTSLTPASLK